MLNGTGDPATFGASTGYDKRSAGRDNWLTRRLLSATIDHGETEAPRPWVLRFAPGGDAATVAGNVASSPDSMRRTDAHHAKEESSIADLLSKMQTFRTTIEGRISGMKEVIGRGRSTMRSGSRRGSLNFFSRLQLCERQLEEGKSLDTELRAKLAESCTVAHDREGGQSDTGIWASSRDGTGKSHAAIRASVEGGLEF